MLCENTEAKSIDPTVQTARDAGDTPQRTASGS